MLNPPDENTENKKLKKARRHENLKLQIISPRAARLLLSQHIWWEHGEHSLLVGIPTDTPEAPTMGPCRASAAKRSPLQRRGRTRSARARRSRATTRRRRDRGEERGERQRHRRSNQLRSLTRAQAREAPPGAAHFLHKTAEANRNKRGARWTLRPTRYP